MSKDQQTLAAAHDLAANAATWADLSNALFDPDEGLVARAYPDRAERQRFLETTEYRAVRQLIDAAQQRSGLVVGATPTHKSGKFVVRLPRSLHVALNAEAESEGVSLNQLVVTKLAVQMSRLAASSMPDMALIARAYLETRNGFSIDRVVADPELDRAFLHRCRELGLSGTDFELNWRLFNGRKNKSFSDLPKTKNYTSSKKDEFEFSSEIAICHVQEQVRLKEDRNLSLDNIICDPDLAARFDQIAARLAPGFTPLDYRWVALGVRKAAGRYASKAKKIDVPSFADMGPTHTVRASQIPLEQGMYIFQCDQHFLFVGETDNLRGRIERHFDTSQSSGLPDWLYDSGPSTITLGILPMPKVTPTKRKIVALGEIHKHRPFFNYSGNRAA